MTSAEIVLTAKDLIVDGQHRSVVGGFSRAERGLVDIKGERYFVKYAPSNPEADWLAREYEVYQTLEREGYEHIPLVIGFTANTLVLEDLSAWHWHEEWTQPRLKATLRAMDALADLDSSAFGQFKPLMDPTEWKSRLSVFESCAMIDQARSTFEDSFELSDQERRALRDSGRSVEVRASNVVHMDIRADNAAYDPETDRVKIIDWNWTQLGDPGFEYTAFLISVIRQQGWTFLSPEQIQKASAGHASLVAAFWLEQCLEEPFKKGDPDGLRRYQYESLKIATELCLKLLQ